MIGVLVVDDSAVVRRVLTQIIDAEADLKVVGSASNGSTGLQRIAQLKPDVVVVDLEMPVMSGLEMIGEIRARSPKLPVIVFSSHTERGAQMTIESLLRGASDYVTKPYQLVGAHDSVRYVTGELLPKIRELAAESDGPVAAARAAQRLRALPPRTARSQARNGVGAVGIAISTGGPVALMQVLPQMPSDLPVPVFIAQHMPALFTREFAARLDRNCLIEVRECTKRERTRPGVAWLARGDGDMVVTRERNAVYVQPKFAERSLRTACPSADVLFASLADVYGPKLLGVVMTGMGADGLRGSEHIAAGGGEIIAQDEATSVVWGMPGAVHKAGLAPSVVPVSRLGSEIDKRVRNRLPKSRTQKEVG